MEMGNQNCAFKVLLGIAELPFRYFDCYNQCVPHTSCFVLHSAPGSFQLRFSCRSRALRSPGEQPRTGLWMGVALEDPFL